MVAMKLYKDVQVSHPIMVMGTTIGVWLDGTRGMYLLSSCSVETMSLHGRHQWRSQEFIFEGAIYIYIYIYIYIFFLCV